MMIRAPIQLLRLAFLLLVVGCGACAPLSPADGCSTRTTPLEGVGFAVAGEDEADRSL